VLEKSVDNARAKKINIGRGTNEKINDAAPDIE
jgi:hypothetical protein